LEATSSGVAGFHRRYLIELGERKRRGPGGKESNRDAWGNLKNQPTKLTGPSKRIDATKSISFAKSCWERGKLKEEKRGPWGPWHDVTVERKKLPQTGFGADEEAHQMRETRENPFLSRN